MNSTCRAGALRHRPKTHGALPRHTLQVVTDAVQHDGETFPKGVQFSVTEAQAKELLKSGGVVKAS